MGQGVIRDRVQDQTDFDATGIARYRVPRWNSTAAKLVSAPPYSGVWGAERLKWCRSYFKDPVFRLKIALCGDSWTDGNYWTQRLFDILLGRGYNYGGAGWISPFNGDQGYRSASIVPERGTITWSSGWTNNTTTSYSPSGADVVSTTDSATMTITLREYYAAVTLVYKKQSGGGTFRYRLRVNGGGWSSYTTVDTNAASAVGSESINTNNYTNVQPCTCEIEVQAQMVGISIAGVIAERGGTDTLSLYKMAATGSTALQFGQSELSQSALNLIAPHVLVCGWGTNEQSISRDPATMKTHIQTLITKYRAIRPTGDLLLWSAGPTSQEASATYTVADYEQALFELAIENEGAFVSLASHLSGYDADQVSANWMAGDTIHPGTYANSSIAQVFADVLGSAPLRAPVETTIIGHAFQRVVHGKRVLVANTQYGGYNVLLPRASVSPGAEICILKTYSDSETITVRPYYDPDTAGYVSETINGASTYALTGNYAAITLVSDGANWIITSARTP